MNCRMVTEGTLAELFDVVEKTAEKPIAIMVFGPNNRLKNKVFSEFVDMARHSPSFKGYSNSVMPAWPVETRVSVGKNILVKMDGEMSTDHSERHRLVMGLRNNGAASVVGVYVKANPAITRSPVKEQIAKLEEHPPTANGLDFFIVIS